MLDALETRKKVLVCQTAPSVRVSIGEEVGLAPGAISTGQVRAAAPAPRLPVVCWVRAGHFHALPQTSAPPPFPPPNTPPLNLPCPLKHLPCRW